MFNRKRKDFIPFIQGDKKAVNVSTTDLPTNISVGGVRFSLTDILQLGEVTEPDLYLGGETDILVEEGETVTIFVRDAKGNVTSTIEGEAVVTPEGMGVMILRV